MTKEIRTSFSNANEAYGYFTDRIKKHGVKFGDTKALFNVGFYLERPYHNHIKVIDRKWSIVYAEREWQWYVSGDPSAKEIAKSAPIWKKMMDKDGNVRSNYGWQWDRENQLNKVINKLNLDHETRQATVSIYDGKEIDTYEHDTPCTYAIQFTVLNGKLNMAVCMRSNDLWYGFCNDQYCFSSLQKYVASRVGLPIGTYYHFAHNLHLYNDKL